MADRHLRALSLLTHGDTIDISSSGSSCHSSIGSSCHSSIGSSHNHSSASSCYSSIGSSPNHSSASSCNSSIGSSYNNSNASSCNSSIGSSYNNNSGSRHNNNRNSSASSSTTNNCSGGSSNNNLEPLLTTTASTLQAAINFQQAMSERMFFEQRQRQQYQQQQQELQLHQQQLYQQQQQARHHSAAHQQHRYAQHYSNYAAPYSSFPVHEPMPVNNYCSRQPHPLLPTPPLYSGPYPDNRWMGHNHSRFSPYPHQQNPPLYGGLLPPAGQQQMPSSASHYPSTDYTHHYMQQQQMPQQPPLNLEMYEQQHRQNLRDSKQRRAYLRNSNSAQNSYTARYNPYGVGEHRFQQSQTSLVATRRMQGQDRQQQMPLLPTDCSVVGAREVSSRCPPETLQALSDISDGNVDTSETDVISNEDQIGGCRASNTNEIPIAARASFGQIHPQEPQQFTGCPTTSQPIINTSNDLCISEVYALSMESAVSLHSFTQVTEELQGECRDNDSDEMLVAYSPRVSSKGTESSSETENESEHGSMDFMIDIKEEPIDDGYPDNETKSSNKILNDIRAERTFQNNNHNINTENNNNNVSIKSTASPFNSICSKTEGSTSTQYPLSAISSSSILPTNSSPTTTERCSPVQCSQTSSASYASQQSQQQQQQEKQQQTKQQQQQQTQNSYHQSNQNSSWSPFPSSPNNWIHRYGPTCDTPTREAESPIAVPVPPHNSPVDYQPSYLPFMPLTTAAAGAGAAAMPTSNPALPTKKSHTKDSDSMAQGKKSKRQPIEVKEEPKENVESLITPLPGFLQAFGSTEIGRFSETFLITPDTGLDSFAAYDENQQQNQQQQQLQKQQHCLQQPQKPPQQQHQRNLHNQQQQHQQHFDYYASPDVTNDHCGASQYVWPSYLDPYLDHANHCASVRDYHWRYGAGQHDFASGYGAHSASPSFSPSAATRYPLRNAMMMSRTNGSFNEIRCNGY